MAVKRNLIKVNGVYIPNPSSLEWGVQSISDSNAGRTSDGTMHVNLVTRKRKLQLSWNAVDFATASEILQAVNPEKFDVTYQDALTNTLLTKKFYVGDRTAPVHSYAEGHQWYANISFDLIEV